MADVGGELERYIEGITRVEQELYEMVAVTEYKAARLLCALIVDGFLMAAIWAGW